MTRFRGPLCPKWLGDPRNFARLKPLLQKLCLEEPQHGMTVEGLCQRIIKSEIRVWVYNDFQAFFGGSLWQQMNGRWVFSISWAAGLEVLQDPMTIYPKLEEWARDHDVHHVEVMGRMGWEKVMKPHGFKPWYRGQIKEL